MLWAVFGRRKSGKTELTKQATFRLATSNGLVLVFDLMRQWPAEYHQPLRSLYERERLDSRLYCVHDCEPEDAARLALKWSPCTFVVDEVDLICGTPTTWKSDAARNIVRRGRHYRGGGVSMIVNGQRFVNAHTDILSLADRISVFYMNHVRDLQVIRDWMGPEYAREVQRLGRFEFVTYPDATVSRLGLGGSPALCRYFNQKSEEMNGPDGNGTDGNGADDSERFGTGNRNSEETETAAGNERFANAREQPPGSDDGRFHQ